MNILDLENLLVYTKILDIENFEYVIDKYKLEHKENETILDFYRRKTLNYLLKTGKNTKKQVNPFDFFEKKF